MSYTDGSTVCLLPDNLDYIGMEPVCQVFTDWHQQRFGKSQRVFKRQLMSKLMLDLQQRLERDEKWVRLS